MLLESIKLENFRQFRNESIDFAQGQDGKNVTIIIGENGTGKTTFAQAFFWCMYGETEFSDKNMLNKMVANDLTPGQEASVRVELKLKHGSVAYTLIREQSYKKDYSGRVKGDNTVFNIAIKGADGNTSYVPRSRCESEVKNILPKELSRYFFFDGERIEKMSKDISTGKKATDFAEAVKGLLGLNAMFSAIQHFNPRMRNTVISSYENSYDSHSNAKIQEYTQIIDECNAKIAEIDARLEELEAQIESAQARKAEKTEELKQYAEGEELQRQKEKLLQKIARAKDARGAVINPLLKANGCIGCSELQDCSRAVNMVMDKLQCDEKEASSVILESIPVESIDTLIEFGLNNANDDYYDDVYLADGCSTCKTEIFRSFLTQVATNTDEIFFELSNKLLRQALDEQLSKLTLKEAEVIKLRYGYYGKERTLEEVGKQFGVTRERIRQIETKAIRKLRHPSRAKHLRDFL